MEFLILVVVVTSVSFGAGWYYGVKEKRMELLILVVVVATVSFGVGWYYGVKAAGNYINDNYYVKKREISFSEKKK